MTISIWNRTGDFYYSVLKKEEQEELEDILEDMKMVYQKYRILRLKQIIDNINRSKPSKEVPAILGARRSKYGNDTYRYTISEWDLKDFAIIYQDVLEDTTREELVAEYKETQEELQIALRYIAGIFKNSRIWKGHIDLLRNYKKQLERGVPLTQKQADTVFKLLHRYSKQIVSNKLL